MPGSGVGGPTGLGSGLVRVLTALVGLAALILVVGLVIVAGMLGAAIVAGAAVLVACLAVPVLGYLWVIRRWPRLRIVPLHRWLERRLRVGVANAAGNAGAGWGGAAAESMEAGREGVRVRGAAERR